MPRLQRVQSKSLVYHVMLRGNERKNIFIDDKDKDRIIEILFDKKEARYKLYAYCVMDNHLHLVIKEEGEGIATAIKRIAVSYAYYFNKKNNRVGHVFQDRFRSENIENERHLLAAIRYVHLNPEKAGIGKWDDYKYSSAVSYLGKENAVNLLEVVEILNLFAKDRKRAVERFKEFSVQESPENFIDTPAKAEIDYENIDRYIREYLHKSRIELPDLKKKEYAGLRKQLVRKLVTKSDFSLRKIAEKIGVNRESVRRDMLSKEPSP